MKLGSVPWHPGFYCWCPYNCRYRWTRQVGVVYKPVISALSRWIFVSLSPAWATLRLPGKPGLQEKFVCLFVVSTKQQTNKPKEPDNRGVGTSAGERVIGHNFPSWIFWKKETKFVKQRQGMGMSLSLPFNESSSLWPICVSVSSTPCFAIKSFSII